jgi:hypothetical protein
MFPTFRKNALLEDPFFKTSFEYEDAYGAILESYGQEKGYVLG